MEDYDEIVLPSSPEMMAMHEVCLLMEKELPPYLVTQGMENMPLQNDVIQRMTQSSDHDNFKKNQDGEGAETIPQVATPISTKGKSWSEEEHRLFLTGLNEFEKGAWRCISRHFVKTRTPTQIASQAQKYFLYLERQKKGLKRKPSIHDIRSVTLPPLCYMRIRDDKHRVTSIYDFVDLIKTPNHHQNQYMIDQSRTGLQLMDSNTANVVQQSEGSTSHHGGCSTLFQSVGQSTYAAAAALFEPITSSSFQLLEASGNINVSMNNQNGGEQARNAMNGLHINTSTSNK